MSESDVQSVMQNSSRKPIRRDAVLAIAATNNNVTAAIELVCNGTFLAAGSKLQAPAGSEAVYASCGQLFETCKICFDATKSTRLEPCQHLLCTGCADIIMKQQQSLGSRYQAPKCPFCRSSITGTGWISVGTEAGAGGADWGASAVAADAGAEEAHRMQTRSTSGVTEYWIPPMLRELSHEEELEDEVIDLRVQRAAAVAEGSGGHGAAAAPPTPGHTAPFPSWYCNVGSANHSASNRIIQESAPGTFLAHEYSTAGGAPTIELYANCQGVVKQCTIRVKLINNVRIYEFNDTDFVSMEQAVQYTLLTLNHSTSF